MRTKAEITAAHDRLVAILLKEVPNPFGENEKLYIKAAADVLCWVLKHEHNGDFASNLDAIDDYMRSCGLELGSVN
jgi:hypothetical protein